MSLVEKVLRNRHLDECGGNGGGVSSWNDLTDKPFGEEGWSIEWDGTPTDEFVEIVSGIGYYKVSEAIPTKDELVGATYKGADAGGESTEFVVESSNIVDHNADCYGEELGMFLVVTQETDVELGDFEFSLTEGLWFMGFGIPTSLGKGEIKTLDKKYIPSEIGTWENMPDKPFWKTEIKYEWDGNTDDLESFTVVEGVDFYHISSNIISETELLGASVKLYFDGDNLEGEISQDGEINLIKTDVGNCIIMYGGQLPVAFVASTSGDDSFGGLSFCIPDTGLWFLHSFGEDEYTHYLQNTLTKKIDEKFLPNTVVLKEEEVEVGSWNSDFSYFNDTDAFLRQNYPLNLVNDIIKIVINDNQVIETTMAQGRYPTIGVLNVDGIFLDGDTTGTSYRVNIDETKFGNINSIKLFVKKYSQFNINALPNELKWLVNYNYDGVITENDRTFVLNNSITKSVEVASADAIKDTLRVNVSIYDTNILMLNTIKETQFKIKQLDLSDNSNVVTVPIYSYYTGELVTDEELPYGVMIVAQSWKSGEWLLVNPIPKLSDCIINSSTEGSTKKFKITVDDSGTISATEVTD